MQDKEIFPKYLIGNWKANKTQAEAALWIKETSKYRLQIHPRLKLVLCPAFIHLSLFKRELPNLTLGSQNLSPYADGAYTGEITARMLRDLVSYAILGHSERERYFQETSAEIALKAIQAIDNQITPIIALSRTNLQKRINALEEKILAKSILMYEPPEAISRQVGPIGEGEAASLSEVREMIKTIKQSAKPQAVIYGGSIKSNNLAAFFSEEVIDGVLPGSASLSAEEWLKMVKIANQTIQNI